jgi:hypothetical protein
MIYRMLASKEFWILFVPLITAVISWIFNEKAKRFEKNQVMKEERYFKLINCLEGFYESINDPLLKTQFINELKLCWLYAPDSIIRKGNEFLSTVKLGNISTSEEKEKALAEFVLSIRKDMQGKSTLNHNDFNTFTSV